MLNFFGTNLQGFDLHIVGGIYTVSLACSQFLVVTCLCFGFSDVLKKKHFFET